MQTLTRDQLEALRPRWREVTFGTSVRVLYWPTVQLSGGVTSTAPSVIGRAMDGTVVQPEGTADPYIAGEMPAGEVMLSHEEFLSLPGAKEFWDTLLAALDAKLLAQQQAPPPVPLLVLEGTGV